MSKALKQALIAVGIIVLIAVIGFVAYIAYKLIRQKKENANIAFEYTAVEFAPEPVQTSTVTVGTGFNSTSTSFVYEGTVSGILQLDYEGKWYAVTKVLIDGNEVGQFIVHGEGKQEQSFSVKYTGSSDKLYTSTDLKIGKTEIVKSDQIFN